MAKEIYVEAMLCHANPDDGKLDSCIESGRYHERIAEWLEDLKRRIEYDDELMGSGALKNAYKSGYNKAIDTFATKICEILEEYQTGFNMVRMANIWHFSREFAEQLKEGILND